MSNRSWEQPSAYAFLRAVRAPRFAWEFLRRNRAFRHHRARLGRLKRSGALHQSDLDGFASRWGVHFRKARRTGRGVGTSLDTCRASDHRDPDDDAAVPGQRGVHPSGQTGAGPSGAATGRRSYADPRHQCDSSFSRDFTALRPTVRGPRRLSAAPLAPGYGTSAWTRPQRFVA